MSDLMLCGILRMPLPEDPKELDPVTFIQIKSAMKEAADRIEGKATPGMWAPLLEGYVDLLMAIAFCDDESVPTIKQLAKRTDTTPHAVRIRLRGLRGLGLVKVTSLFDSEMMDTNVGAIRGSGYVVTHAGWTRAVHEREKRKQDKGSTKEKGQR